MKGCGNMTNNKTANILQNYLDSKNNNIDITSLNDELFVIIQYISDDKIKDRVIDILDKKNIEWGYYDEYTTCHECYNAIRTSPDSYSWIPEYHLGDGFIVCKDCIDADNYIDDFVNNPKKANTVLTHEQLIEKGFTKYNDDIYQNSWNGHDDSPKVIFEELKDKYEYVLFSINHTEQFGTSFNVYVK